MMYYSMGQVERSLGGYLVEFYTQDMFDKATSMTEIQAKLKGVTNRFVILFTYCPGNEYRHVYQLIGLTSLQCTYSGMPEP